VSIRDNHEKREGILAMLQRCRSEIQRHINRDLLLKYTPRLTFDLDTSVEKGDAMLGLLLKMEEETAAEEQRQADIEVDAAMENDKDSEGA
jgi:ribosome-binding factor A